MAKIVFDLHHFVDLIELVLTICVFFLSLIKYLLLQVVDGGKNTKKDRTFKFRINLSHKLRTGPIFH